MGPAAFLTMHPLSSQKFNVTVMLKAKYPRCEILCGFYFDTSHDVSRRAARPYVMPDDPGAELAGVEFRVARGSRADDVVADHRVGH